MKLWVGVTDKGWFEYLRAWQPDEVNFWQPSGGREFRTLRPGEPFLFKLHSPNNFIVGGGFFVRYSALPCSLAWEAFGDKNGVRDMAEFLTRIRKYRERGGSERLQPDPVIGCNVLAAPFFFPEPMWIPVPTDWAPNIVQGKSYDSESEPGASLWKAVQRNLQLLGLWQQDETDEKVGEERPEYLVRGRLGQGAFRILVTDAYQRRCAITGERTLPVLEAAHIKPYARSGPHSVRNGLLLRSDLHKLFDKGYLTVTPDLRVEVSRKIKEEYENGREYYAYHGKELRTLPSNRFEQPSKEFLEWHNQNIYVS
ncbi:MAG TPA: HNH endonuclease [Burkholderiales bacterium]